MKTMSGAARCDEMAESYLPTGTEGKTALRQLAAERLAAHRGRRSGVEGGEGQAAMRLQAQRDAMRAEGHPDASRVRAAVAARYQESLSYREFLAAEARRAAEQAHAEAEVAARKAKAVAEAQRQLLDEMEQWKQPETAAGVEAFGAEPELLEVVEQRAEQAAAEAKRAKSKTREEVKAALTPGPLQVRLHEEIELASPSFRVAAKMVAAADGEMAELDEEIEFRAAPEFRDLVLETQPIQANIIEFPRQLVASRKARPRLAEGPLREDGTAEPQLRIFEVEAEQISAEPEMVSGAAPEWQGLLLGAAAQSGASMSRQLETQLQMDHPIYAASLGRRMLSIAVDGLCIGAGVAGFAAAAVKVAGEALRGITLPLPLSLVGGMAAGTAAIFIVLYQLLFFTLNEATPGMRVARIAFCTFNEKSPTRRAMRRRLLSTALAACPLGLGLLWTVLDGDRLGWHDRISRMYPRGY
jgi:uncharacterized RDD family membrane protein YckC